MFFDMNYLLWVVLPGIVLSGIAQFYVRSAYSRWSQVRNGANLGGAQVAETIFNRTNLAPTPMAQVPGQMTDHYDPGQNIVRLSQGTVQSPSIAAMAIAAHELGHVQQFQQQSPLIQARQFLVPAVKIGPNIGYIMIIAGLMLNVLGLAWLGVILFAVSALFMLVTLPVELDASNRAMRLLDESGLLVTAEDRQGARAVLNAAAFTYLAALVTSLLQLVYYISLVQRRN